MRMFKLSEVMSSIWTITRDAFAFISKRAQSIAKTILICVISVAMWLPMCIAPSTAIASETVVSKANDSKTSASSSSDSSDSSASSDDSNAVSNALRSLQLAASNLSANSNNPFTKASSVNKFVKDSFGSNLFNLKNTSNPFNAISRLSNLDAQSQNRAAQNRSDDRDSYPPYTPGCNKDYALGECFTTKGDGAGLRATNGHDLDVNGLGYRQGGPYERNRGYYKNGPVPEDPSGSNHYAETYFTPYPKGTYIVKRLRNLAYDDAGRGIDTNKTPLDDVADFVFVKRTPKASGGGFVWDVIFNAGGRTHGAADALNYFTVPENQILDKGSEGGRQYIQRVLYTGRERSALYLKKKHNEDLKNQKKPEDPSYVPPRETCSFSWDNPNGLCSIETTGGDVLPSETIEDAWIKSNDQIRGNNGYSHIVNTPQIGEGGNQKENYEKNGNFIGTCNDGYALDCMHSTNYAFPSGGDHQLAPKLEGAYSRGYSPAYVKLIDNLYKAIRGTKKTKIFLFTNKLKNGDLIPYTYKIHFTTTTARGHENDSFFYGAGSYFGATSPSLTYGKTDPFGAWSSIYSLKAAGRFSKSYRYTSLYEQWYGVPRIMDVQSPRLHFLKGTGLGPFGPGLNKDGEFPLDGDDDPSTYGNNGKYISRYGICLDSSGKVNENCKMEISSMLLEDENGNPLINRALASSPGIQETKDIRLLPDFYSPNNNYARGNQWFRYPGVDDHNTKDSTPGRHKLQLKYRNDYYQISETQDLWYRIITQADVFKPLQTEEWNKDDKTPTYYSYDKPLPNPIVLNSGSENKGFVNFENNKGRLYDQVKSFDPNLYTDVLNSDLMGNQFKYGSVKDTYPLDRTYEGSKDNGANDAIKDNAVYKAEWTDKWGDKLMSNTLKDAETKIAVKVPIVTVSNRCAHSKILDDFKDETDESNRSASNGDRSANYANRDGGDRDSGDRDSADRDSNIPECWPKPQQSTARNVWYIYYAPKGSKQGDPVPEKLINKAKDKASGLYRTWMRNGYSAQLQDGKSPEVLPNYVFVKYLKITFWDDSTTVIPVVFPYVDYEKPTLDVKVSVNNGKPMTVPADGLKIATKSRIKFWVKGHDDRKIMLGVNGKNDDQSKYNAEIKKYVGKDFYNDFEMITKSKSGKDCAKNGCGNFTTISYDDFVHDNGMPNTETDKEGWVINDKFNGSNGGSPQVDVADRGVHDLIFHGWDEVGNSVIKKIRLIIVSPGYGLPNVWWDKKRNGHYVGRVNPWDEDKRVRSIMVRIWPRGKDGPAETKDKSHGKDLSFDEKCPTDGSCYGIIIQRHGNTDRWEQVNTYKGKNLAAGADASRAAADDDRAHTSDDQLREKYSKRVITSDLDKYFKGCTAKDGDSCEITFDPATGNIEIPEYFAEIGSRIYVDAYSVAENTPNKSQKNLWPIIGDYEDHYKDHEESDPLPLDITWPNGLVQVSPFELNDSETGALLTWMRHDNKNERIFGYRKEEIGIKGEDKYDTYNRYDASNSFTYAYGESKNQYSCKADNNHKNDLQWKLCLDISPKRISHDDFPTAETASNMKHSKKNLTIDKLEAKDETVLNPATHEVTRYVNMRKDYKWDLKSTKVSGRDSDPGLKWYGDKDFGNEYLVYKWDINTKKRLNTNAVLDLIKGTPVIPDPTNKPQPSLKYLDGSKNKHDILYGPHGNDGWDGDLPDRGNWYGYAPNDGTCKLAYADNLGKCQWENVLDLVKYDSVSESGRKGSFADDVNVNMELKKNGKGEYVETGNEVSITDRINQGEKHSTYAIHKHFLMPGGANVNGQADGLDIGDTDADTKDGIKHGVILENRRVRYVNDYDDVPTLKGSERENQEQHAKRYFAKRPFMHAQLYVHNGSIVNDLTFRVNGDQNTTTNVINVWFVPVDGQKPTISGKSYPEKNKAWNIHGICMLPGQGKKDCTPIDDDLIDLEKNDWYRTDTGTLLLPENLKLEDDFNAYTPTGQIDVKISWRKWLKVDTGQSSKALLGNLQIDIEADGVKDSKGRTPRIRFVRDGYEDKYLIRRFIERYRSTDLQNPDPAKPTTFRMFAKTSDSVGNESEETAVGCFKTKWTKMESPSVVAYYDGENNDQPANSDNLWLNGNDSYVKRNGEPVTNARRNNVVKVTSPQYSKRMVVYYNPNNSADNAVTEDKLSIGKTLSVCWFGNNNWRYCDDSENKPSSDEVEIKNENGNAVVLFKRGKLAPGSVVRARARRDIGPWTWMPGVKSIEELVENSDVRNGNRNKSARAALVEPAGASNRSSSRSSSKNRASDANEDTLDVLPMEIAKERTDEVCRPDDVKPSDWKSKPSDCVYFDVSMRRRIVQVHPMLLSNPEQRAIRLELTKENHNIGKWLSNDSEVVTNDDIKLGAGKTMVTFREYDYRQKDEQDHEIYKKPEVTPSYGSIPQEKQDLVVFTSGWRSRVLVPLPRDNQVTRFVRLRSVDGINSDGGGNTNKGQDDDGLGNGAADYVVDVPMKNGTQDRSKAPKIEGRADDPGLVLSPDKKSLFYVYNLSDKTPVNFNDLQSVVNLKLNKKLHPDDECKGLDGKTPLPFADCQPSLRAEIKGNDKVIAETTRTDGLNAINGNMMYTLSESSEKTSFINIIDMQDITDKNGHNGGGFSHINVCRKVDDKQVCGETAEDNASSRKVTDFAGKPRWGSSGAIDRSFKLTDTNKIFESTGSDGRNRLDNRLIMSLGVSWVDKTIYDARGRESEGSDHAKQDANDSVDEAVMPVYLVATDNVKPTVKAAGALEGTSVTNPYGVDVDNIDFTFNTKDENNQHSDSSVSKDGDKKRFIDAYDDYDTRATVKNKLKVYVRMLNGVNPQDSEWNITKQDGSVNSEELKNLLATNGKTAIYAVYAQTEDSVGNKSEGYGASKDDKSAILGYIQLGGINVKPIALPFSGGKAAIWFTLLFGVLLALFLASGAFGKRGWLVSVIRAKRFARAFGKHCSSSLRNY